jgi:hypothetical protein
MAADQTDLLKPIRYLRRLERLRKDRSTFRDHWRDLADHFLPRHVRFEPTDRWRAGTKKNQKIINSTGTRALRILASGMMAGITSPARPWFRLKTASPIKNRVQRVRAWLEQVERTMFEVFARSNIYNGLATSYESLAGFGTSAMFVGKHPRSVIRAHMPPLGSYHIALNEHYEVNTFYRETTLTVEQIMRRFDHRRISPSTIALWDNKEYDAWRECIQVIEPNDRVMHNALDRHGMPWRSVWIEWGAAAGGQGVTSSDYSAGADDRILGYSGFHEFPVMAPRWQVTGEDAYGSAPAMDALGDTRQLQNMERKKARALAKIVDPPMKGPSGMKNTRTSILPGDMTYVDEQGRSAGNFEPAHTVDHRIMMMDAELSRVEKRIMQAFFADMFLMIASMGRGQPVTAREIEERHEEKMLQLGPVLERIQDELLDKLIDRCFGLLFRMGLIPPPPDELIGEEIRPEYISILAQAQKLILTVGVERLVGFTMQMAEARPDALDKLNVDGIIDEYGDLLGTNPELVLGQQQVEAVRRQRQQAEALNRETAGALKDATEAAKNVDEIKDPAALAQMMGGMNAQGEVARA